MRSTRLCDVMDWRCHASMAQITTEMTLSGLIALRLIYEIFANVPCLHPAGRGSTFNKMVNYWDNPAVLLKDYCTSCGICASQYCPS